MNKSKCLRVYVDEQTRNYLQERAVTAGESVSSIVRRFISLGRFADSRPVPMTLCQAARRLFGKKEKRVAAAN